MLVVVEGDGAAPFPEGDFFGDSFLVGDFSFTTPGDAPDLPFTLPPNRNMPPKGDEPLLANDSWGSGVPFSLLVAAGFAEGLSESTLETAFDVTLGAAAFEGVFGADFGRGFGAGFGTDFGAGFGAGFGTGFGAVGDAFGSGFAGSPGAFALEAVFGRVAVVAGEVALEAGSLTTVGFDFRLIALGVIESTNLRKDSGAGRLTKSGRGMPNPARTPKKFPSPSVSPVEGSIGKPV